MRSNIARTSPASRIPGDDVEASCAPACPAAENPLFEACAAVSAGERPAPAPGDDPSGTMGGGARRLLHLREEVENRLELRRWHVLERGHRLRRVHERAGDPFSWNPRGDVREVGAWTGVAVVADRVTRLAA